VNEYVTDLVAFLVSDGEITSNKSDKQVSCYFIHIVN